MDETQERPGNARGAGVRRSSRGHPGREGGRAAKVSGRGSSRYMQTDRHAKAMKHSRVDGGGLASGFIIDETFLSLYLLLYSQSIPGCTTRSCRSMATRHALPVDDFPSLLLLFVGVVAAVHFGPFSHPPNPAAPHFLCTAILLSRSLRRTRYTYVLGWILKIETAGPEPDHLANPSDRLT